MLLHLGDGRCIDCRLRSWFIDRRSPCLQLLRWRFRHWYGITIIFRWRGPIWSRRGCWYDSLWMHLRGMFNLLRLIDRRIDRLTDQLCRILHDGSRIDRRS